MKRLEAEQRRLEEQIKGLSHELAAIKRAIALVRGDATPDEPAAATAGRKPRSSVKEAVLELLEEHREVGLSAVEVVECASRRGVTLDRGSVSSYLSRLKREGVLGLYGSKYRFPPKAEADHAANLH